MPAPVKGRKLSEDTARLTARIVELRGQRYKWDDIARIVDHSKGYCCDLYHRALSEIPVANVVQAREEEVRLAEDATRKLIEEATDDSNSPRTRIEAWNSIRGWREHIARMTGLNAPVKSQVQVITEDHIDAAIRELEQKLVANDPRLRDAPVEA